MFEPLPSRFDFPESERKVLDFWERERIFAKSLQLRAGAPRFVFYEGPPTANGLPHPGHCLTRAIKDLFPRYQTMRGHLVERKAGWDTHGLPVEVEVCKELGIHGKEEIEQYGVEKFVQKCIESVFRYMRQWEDMTRRLGFWVNLEQAYVTYHQRYVESVWWGLKQLFQRGLLYQGHKVVWWWAQGGTALSAGEVGEGYRTVDDASVFVKFPLFSGHGRPNPRIEHLSEEERAERFWELVQKAESTTDLLKNGTGGEPDYLIALNGLARMPGCVLSDTEDREEIETIVRLQQLGPDVTKKLLSPRSLLIWTTTPWTLLSNQFAAVHPELEYALVHDAESNENFFIATDLVGTISTKVKRELQVLVTCKGAELIDEKYSPPFPEVFADCERTNELDGAAQQMHMTLARLAADEEAFAFIGWRVVAADFVTLDAGTGLVHEAPAFGEVDFDLLQKERERFANPDAIPLLCAVAPNGTFNDDAPERYRGRWVKDCDAEIVRELKNERKTPWGTPLLYHQELYRHEYPFCPRAEDDPLIQYARKSWFVRTSRFKDAFLANNAVMNWLPEHIRAGRFGDFLRNNVDWALSRERFWGTPLPIWVCEHTGRMEAIGSFAELLGKPGASDGGFWARKAAEARETGHPLPVHLRVHKPYIDEWTYDSPFAHAEENTPKAPEAQNARGAARRTQGAAPRMRRVPEVIDCWWDAGSMPFAQWGFPHAAGSVETFRERFPADFISEAIDQTRGWFYGLLAISTMLFGEDAAQRDMRLIVEKAHGQQEPTLSAEEFAKLGQVGEAESAAATPSPVSSDEAPQSAARGGGLEAPLVQPYPLPFRTCIVLGHMMGEDGNKMSKRLRNYKEPSYVFDHYGADAMRWYFFSAQVPWTSTRFVEASIRDSQREFLVKLYNVLSFFNIYANIDGYALTPAPPGSAGRQSGTGWRPAAQRNELDRWALSELHRTVRFVRESLDRFENYPAAGRLSDFVEALSNWYVRRSRERFWRGLTGGTAPGAAPSAATAMSASDQDKWDAYNTLHECLLTLSMLIAPFTPFFAETMFQNLKGTGNAARATDGQSERDPAILSVHLCDYPDADETLIDERLAAEMELVRELVSLGRAARTSAKLKVRQPLALVEVILARHEHEAWTREHADLIAEELNVKQVDFSTEADHYVTYQIVPNFKALGPKFGKSAPRLAAALKSLADPADARKTLAATGHLLLNVDGTDYTLTRDEVDIRLEARSGWSAAQGRAGVVVVKTEITPELKEEGLIRELIHHVQSLRKEQDLPYEARVTLHLAADEAFVQIVRRFEEVLRRECLAERVEFGGAPAGAMHSVKVDEYAVQVSVVVGS